MNESVLITPVVSADAAATAPLQSAPLHIPELLAPAGGLRQLAAAVAAGADAVYLGLGKLNARVSAAGFSWGDLARGCTLAHAHGARVYAALNIFLYDSEFETAFELVKRALACGVDAFIVADLGLIDALGRQFPDIEIHLSTQAGVHAPEGLHLVRRELGVERVTVARELSIPEIAELCATGVEVEVFCHGAICISYSGACCFSAYRRGTSAMRGDCKQPCRSNYQLVDATGANVARVEGEKLLCPRDFLGIAHVPELCRAGVASLKIEGRMKNPEYVFNVTRAYRQALDCVAAGRPLDERALTNQLARTFNRGFTDIYLRGAKAAADLMSFERAINQGVRVGEVVQCGYQKIYVALEADVHVGDTFEVRFYPENEPADIPKRWPLLPCVLNARAGDTIEIRCKRKVYVGSQVFLTRDAHLIAESDAAIDALLAEVPAGEAAEAGMGEEPATTGGRAKRGEDETSATVSCDCGAATSLVEVEGASCAALSARSEGLVELLPGEAPPADAVVLPEMLRTDNRAATLQAIAQAQAAGCEVVCRNIAQIELCRQAGARFAVAKPLFCSNARTEALLKRWGAQAIYRADPTCQLMVMDHCVLTAEGPCSGDCPSCARRRQERYLIEQDGGRVRVEVDAHGRTSLYGL